MSNKGRYICQSIVVLQIRGEGGVLKSLLIVDDQTGIRFYLEEVFRREGFETTACCKWIGSAPSGGRRSTRLCPT